jgi:hypothetical protein
LFWNPYSFRIRYVASLLSVQAPVNASDHSGHDNLSDLLLLKLKGPGFSDPFVPDKDWKDKHVTTEDWPVSLRRDSV